MVHLVSSDIHLSQIFSKYVARTISRLLFERFLSRMPHLRQLELIVSSGGSVNLLEGNQWKLFIQKYLPFLSIFNFKFKLIPIDRERYNEKNVLSPFYSPFWLNRNPPWYIGYNINDLILYTIPYFVPREIKHSLFINSFDAITLPVEQYSIYYNQINELELDSTCRTSYRYPNIQRLILSVATIDESTIDLSKVKYLCVRSSSWSLRKLFQIIKKSMTGLYHLEIQFNISMIQLCDVAPLDQIRVLDLPQFSGSLNGDNSVDLSSLFPCVEYLTIRLNSIDQMVYLIDRFRYLSSASFHIINGLDDINHIITESDAIRKWLREKSNRLATNNDFTCRLDSQSGIWIHLWISNAYTQAKKVYSIIHTY